MTQPNKPLVSQRAEACAKALFEFDNEGCTWEEWLDYTEQHRTFQGMVRRYREKGAAIAETLASLSSEGEAADLAQQVIAIPWFRYNPETGAPGDIVPSDLPDQLATAVLASTPSQSDVIEKCARVAEEYPSMEAADIPVVRGIAAAIRAVAKEGAK